MSASQGLLVCWVLLVSLSAGTVLAGAAGLWLVVLLLAASKAWLIADGFMELRHATWRWRLMLLGWAVVLVLLIGVIC